MRKFTTLVALLLMAVATFAQAPQGFSYQAVVRDAQNAIVAHQPITVTVSILQGDDLKSATEIYSEKHNTVTNQNGLFTLVVGGGQTTDKFSAIDWSKGKFFVSTKSDYGESATQLMSVPYAMYAEKAASVDAAQLAQTLSNSNDVKAILNLGATTIVNNALAEANYATTSSVNTTVNNALANYATTENVNTTVNNALANYTTTEKLKDALSLYAKIEDLPEGVNLTGYAKTADLATVATSGDYNDLTNKPTIPTAVSQLTDANNYLTTSAAASTYATKSSLKTVATTGSYNDLTNKPAIPTVPTAVSAFTNDANYLKTTDAANTYATIAQLQAQVESLQGTIAQTLQNANKIGDMPLVDVKVKITNNCGSATTPTVEFMGTTMSSGERTFRIPAFSPVFLSVKLSSYSGQGNVKYSYKVKVNNVDFDPELGYYYLAKGTPKSQTENTTCVYTGTIVDRQFTSGGQTYTYQVVETEQSFLPTPIYKKGSGETLDPFDPTSGQTQTDMVNQIVGPFSTAGSNTIEIIISRSNLN